MKKYIHKLKKWVSPEDYEKHMNARDLKLCRSKKPHDFVLVLPSFVTYNEDYKHNPEVYYKLMDDQYEYSEMIARVLRETYGIIGRHWNHKETRLYICSVCKKHKYE